MATKDWIQTYLGKTLVRFENIKNKQIVYVTPMFGNKVNGSWTLHTPSPKQKIDYRGKREVKKAMKAYMRSH